MTQSESDEYDIQMRINMGRDKEDFNKNMRALTKYNRKRGLSERK
jgi:hypothetical protein